MSKIQHAINSLFAQHKDKGSGRLWIRMGQYIPIGEPDEKRM